MLWSTMPKSKTPKKKDADKAPPVDEVYIIIGWHSILKQHPPAEVPDSGGVD